MTKAVMTAQPSGATNNRQQATEADTLDDRQKLTKQISVTSDYTPFSPRRSVQRTVDRNTRRSATVAQPINPTERDASQSKKQPRTPLTATQISELSQRLKRPTISKSSTGEPLTPTSKLAGKEESPPSASHSDSPRAKNATQNRAFQSKTSSDVANVDESSPLAVIMYTSTGGTEHGKPPKTPRSFRTTTSRSDGLAVARPTTARAGDSEAISIPAATYAMKAGPQTVISQWMISLNDNFDDEERSDNQHSAKWEDAQEKLQR